MTITSIGSSFSYIRPEAAARETSAAAVSEESIASAATGSAAASAPQASGSAKPSVADELRALLVKTQENHSSPPAPHAAARAYAGH
ncbi:hypothetical protein [Pinisolibacter sp.]|uniref:hypothetical protein n=1 Tax=Pinisolibacter sp. TaxID=2172024 RepID=UPI002FDE905C